MTHELLRTSATELAQMIRRRKVSPVDLVEAHISRIQAVNPAINALVADRFVAAREEARAAEARVMASGSSADLPPLLGVPCTVKEFFALRGMPHSAGVVARRHLRASEDSEAVRRLRNAGAIPLGVSNVPEGGMWMETCNRIYGRTNNPWNLGRTSGGSSGGEAALVSSGCSPLGLASDVSGSIRIPAAFCGVVGHKPTGRMVPNTGQWPGIDGQMSAILCAGPLTRHTRDLMPILRLLAGPDGRDSVVERWSLGDPDQVDCRNLIVYPVESLTRAAVVWPSMRQAIRQAASALELRGARVVERLPVKIEKALLMWGAVLEECAAPKYREMLGAGGFAQLLGELIKMPFGRSVHTMPSLVVMAIEELGQYLPGGGVTRMAQQARWLRQQIEEVLGPNGVILHPPYTRPAPHHRAPLMTPFDFLCTGLFSVMELPVTQMPVGFDRAGLPLGVQIVGRRGNDHVTMAAARILEEELGGWHCSEPVAQAAGSGRMRQFFDVEPNDRHDGSLSHAA